MRLMEGQKTFLRCFLLIEDGYRHEISDLGSPGIVLSMKRNLRRSSAALFLHSCFRIYAKSRFSHDGLHKDWRLLVIS